VVHEASEAPDLDHYELRGNLGGEFSSEDAEVLATHGPNDPLQFVTDFGLTQPGARIALSVYVVTTTGNERGSAAMIVERPAV
jgi:hypothetical protein